MWLTLLLCLAIAAALVVGFLLGRMANRQSLEAGVALHEGARQILDLKPMHRTNHRLLALLERQEAKQKEWLDRLERMDNSLARVINALVRMGGIERGPTGGNASLQIGDRHRTGDSRPSTKSGSGGHDEHI